VGYADGFLRIFGNGNACVKIQGKKFRTLGNICMDMCMAEGGKEGEIKENAEVVIFDSVEDLEELSRIAGTIPYEIISLISSRVKRVYIYD
jgi:alanine racemase